MNTYSDWRGAVPEGHEACPGCGTQERISRDHPTGLKLGCRWCDFRVVLPSDDPAVARFFTPKPKPKPKITRLPPPPGAENLLALMDALGDEAFNPPRRKKRSETKEKGLGPLCTRFGRSLINALV